MTDKRELWQRLAAGSTLAMTALLPLAVLRWHSPDELPHWLHWECPWQQLTGLPCAGCGMTRALFAFFQGQWQIAFHSHPLVLLPVAAWLLVLWFLALKTTGRLKTRPRPWWGWLGATAALLLFAVWLVRLILLYSGRS